MEKLISVTIPAYNAEKTIEKCIKSINDNNIEVVVVIDGATDGTLKICKALQNDRNYIKIIEQDNKGLLKAREVGIQHSTGKYVMFLDADDCYLENTISKMQEMIKKYHEPDLIRFRYKKVPDGYEQYKYMDADEQKIEKQEFAERVYPMFLDSYMLNPLWTNCVKRTVLEKLKMPIEEIGYGEDLARNLEIFSNIENAIFTNYVLYQYNSSENSMTNTKSIAKLIQNLKDAIKVYPLIYTYLIRWNMYNVENVELMNRKMQKEVEALLKLIEMYK